MMWIERIVIYGAIIALIAAYYDKLPFEIRYKDSPTMIDCIKQGFSNEKR